MVRCQGCPTRGRRWHNFEEANTRSNKGHDTVNLQYSCGPVGCHLRRKVVDFAVSHETHKPKVSRHARYPQALQYLATRAFNLGHPLRGTHNKMNGSDAQESREF